MALTRNLRLTGRAAATDLADRRTYLFESAMDEDRRKTKKLTIETCQQIRDMMTQEEYDSWWTSAPEKGFLKYATEYLQNMKEAREIQEIDQWLDSDLDTNLDGTEPSPIISGGEVLYITHPTGNDDIPF